jgi:hypothetical protein
MIHKYLASPEGTNENGMIVFSQPFFQPSLRDFGERYILDFPEIKFLGYFQMSLRDNKPHVKSFFINGIFKSSGNVSSTFSRSLHVLMTKNEASATNGTAT